MVLATSLGHEAQAQRDYYVKLFDLVHQKNGVTGNGNPGTRYWNIFNKTRTQASANTKGGAAFAEGDSYILEAYALMGVNTSNPNHKEYCDYFLTMMSHVLSQRDDQPTIQIHDGYNTANVTTGQCTSTPIPPPVNPGRIEKWWCGTYENSTGNTATYGAPGKSGHNLYPAMIWIYGVLSSTQLKAYNYFEDGNTAYQNAFSNVWNGMTYEDIAMLLLQEVEYTLDVHELYQWVEWVENGGVVYGTFFREFWTFPGYSDMIGLPNTCDLMHGASNWSDIHDLFKLPLNYHSSIGRCYVLCWKTYDMLGTNATKTAKYLDMSQRMGNYARWHIRDLGLHADNGYKWYYSDYYYDISTNPQRDYYAEDYAHLHVSVEFPYLCYKLGLPYNASVNVFDATDMERMGRAIDRAFKKNRAFWKYSNANTGDPYEPYYQNPPSFDVTLSKMKPYADMSEYGQFIPNVYHQGLDGLCDKYLNAAKLFTVPGYSHNYALSEFKSLAYNICERGQEYQDPTNKFWFRVVATKRGWGNGSNWIGISGGDLDESGEPHDLVVVRNGQNDRHLGMYRLNTDALSDYNNDPDNPNYRSMEPIYSNNNPSWISGVSYAGAAVGDLDPALPGDEIAIVRNQTSDYKHFYLIDTDGDTYASSAAFYSGYGNASNWIGVCVGNFDGVAGDEMASIRTNDGSLAMLKYSSGSLVGVSGGSPITGITDGKSITAGNINGDSQDEIVVVRSGGQLEIFKYLAGSTTASASITPSGSILGSGEFVLDACLGDFNGDQQEDELMILSNTGNFYMVKLQLTSLSGTSHSWSWSVLHKEKFNSDFFANGAALGTMRRTFEETDCAFDYLLVARNSSADGHLMIIDAGLELSPTHCYQFEYESASHYEEHKRSTEQTTQVAATEGEVKVYPNPAANQVNIACPKGFGVTEMTLFDAQGRLISRKQLNEGTNTLPIHHLTSGMFIMRFVSQRGDVQHVRLSVR